MENIRCYCCGKELPVGSLKYVIEIKSFADFDGYLEEYEGDAESAMVELIEEMEDMDQDILEGDVYKEMMFVLCKSCRDRFHRNPFTTHMRLEADEEEIKGTIH